MARGFVGSLRMYPLDCSASRWVWTVEGEASPTASAISRTLGGYPRASTVDRMNSRIRFWRGPRAPTPPAAVFGTSPPVVGAPSAHPVVGAPSAHPVVFRANL